MGSFASRLRGRLVIFLVTLPLLVASVLAVPVSAGASKAPIKIAILNEASGEFAAQFGPVQVGALAWVDWENAHGGVDGHHIDVKTYNNGSNPSSAVANAHLAAAQGAVALIDSDPLFDSYAPYLHSLDMPVYAFGITPGFYGATNSSFFSYSGDIADGKSDAAIKFYVQQFHKTK